MAATPAPTRAVKGTWTPAAPDELPPSVPLLLPEAPGAEAEAEPERALLRLAALELAIEDALPTTEERAELKASEAEETADEAALAAEP